MEPLENYLPYLLNRAGGRIAEAFGKEMRPLGATLQMWRVLAALRERDGRRMGDLAATTSIEVSTLTRLVDGMEKKGLVIRRRAAADARAIVLHVTAGGRRLTGRILPIASVTNAWRSRVSTKVRRACSRARCAGSTPIWPSWNAQPDQAALITRPFWHRGTTPGSAASHPTG